jgi:hypothetical protein
MADQLEVGLPPSAAPPRRTRRWYRRPVLVVPLVLVLIAAVCVVLVIVFRSGNPSSSTSGTGSAAAAQPVITVNGTVVDAMTGHPVATATVGVAGHSTRTDTRGVFELSGVRPNAVLTIRSRNYASATVAAARGPVRIRLVPIPVRVRVVSALTGALLPAAIRTPERARVVAAAGVAAVYGVGPGDRVTVTAAGYRPATVSVAGVRAVRAALQPVSWRTAAPQILTWMKTKNYTALANWVFSPASGYQFYLGHRSTSSGVVSVEAHVVGENATANLSVIPYGYVDTSGQFEGGGSRVILAGQRARHGTIHVVGNGPPGAGPMVGTDWYRSPLDISVIGDDLAVTDKIMAGIIAALPRSD